MNKIVEIKVTRESGEVQTFAKGKFVKWLLIATTPGLNVISLSGDDEKNAFLLRMLENAVVQTMNETHVYKDPNKEATQ